MWPRWLGFVVFVGIFTLLSACVSSPKVDWNSRVGQYTFDQAVLDMGPPDKSTTLSDGKKVAEWITIKRSGVSFGVGTGFSTGGVGLGVGQSVAPGRTHRTLRLIFDDNGRLNSFERR